MESWVDKVFDVLLKASPLPAGKEIISAYRLKPPRVKIQDMDPVDSLTTESILQKDRSKNLSGYQWMTLATNKRLTSPEWFQDVRHLEFDSQRTLE